MSAHDLSHLPLLRSLTEGEAVEAAKSERCFITGPFDSVSAAEREHAEEVLAYVIRPALLDTPFAPRRIEIHDSEDKTARATVDALLTDPVAIIIACGRGPAMDYALTVKKAMNRPAIVLTQEGSSPSVEVADARVVSYSFRPRALLGSANVDALRAALHQAMAAPAPQAQPAIVTAPAPTLASATSGPQTFTDDQRMGLVREARLRLDMMGISNLAFASRPDLPEFLCSDAARGLEVRVLQCAPGNPGLPTIVGARDIKQLALVQGEIEAAAEAWRRIAENPACRATITLRRAQTSVPLSSAIITESAMGATPYLFSRAGVDAPTYLAATGANEYAAMAEEFNALWGEATTLLRSAAGDAPATAQPAPLVSAHLDPVNRVRVDVQVRPSQPAAATSAPPAPTPAPASTRTEEPRPEEPKPADTSRPNPAVIPPSSTGLLKGFSSLRGITGN